MSVHLPGAAEAAQTTDREFRDNVRGSNLLLGGRGLAIGVKFIAQVLIVRYLSMEDFGAWAYALGFVMFLSTFTSLSLNRSLSRFAAIYQEKGDRGRLFGSIALVSGVILGTGALAVLGVVAFPGVFARYLPEGGTALALLPILVALVPLDALDRVSIEVFATFGETRAIFVRRYLLTPGVQLGVTLLLLWFRADVTFLAYGYVGGALLGLVVNLWLLLRIVRESGLLADFGLSDVRLPAREMFGFSLPLISGDALAAVTKFSGVMLLGYHFGERAVADFRVVMPLATQNSLVLQTFSLLFVPAAARLFAREDHAGIQDLYWRLAVWVTVLSFPLFALTFAVATPLTSLVFGERYAASGIVLAILALGFYVDAIVGFNRQTLRVLGRIRMIVALNGAGIVVNLALALALVPRLGAVGAAWTMAGTIGFLAIARQIALVAASPGFRVFDRRYARPYAAVGAAVVVLLTIPRLGGGQHAAGTAAVISSAAVVFMAGRKLGLAEVYPVLRRVPVLRAFVA